MRGHHLFPGVIWFVYIVSYKYELGSSKNLAEKLEKFCMEDEKKILNVKVNFKKKIVK